MSESGKRRRIWLFVVVFATVAISGAAVGAALDADPDAVRQAHPHLTSGKRLSPGAALSSPASSAEQRAGVGSPPCGTTSATIIAGVDAAVAGHIYAGELNSGEVSADIARITGSRALLSALASNDQAAVYAAVHSIVYTPLWHIVRLRVVKSARVVADVGGPDIIAPVSGTLRWKGRAIGRYLMSVQDDLGYVKLVSRFIGVPIDLYRKGSFLMGTLEPAPSLGSTHSSVSVGGAAYQVQLLSARAFPSGTLQIALLIPTPPPDFSAASCASVRLAAWGAIATHIAARFTQVSAHYDALVRVLRGTTGGLAYVRSGSTRIAGGTGPARIPEHGTVRYAGRSWAVFSWEPAPPARIYFLTPAP